MSLSSRDLLIGGAIGVLVRSLILGTRPSPMTLALFAGAAMFVLIVERERHAT